MSSLIIILVLLVAVLGTGAYALVSTMQSLQANVDKLAIEARLEDAAQAVLANIVSVTSPSLQYYAVPAPDVPASPTVPSWITPLARTWDGTNFLYCPFTNRSTGTKGTTITTPGGSYTVNQTTLYASSKNYVTISDARPTYAQTALAIIVAPASKLTTLPDCQNIGSDLTLAGALVRVITEEEVQAKQLVTAANGTEFYAAPAAIGDGSGRNSTNAVKLDDMLNYLNQFRPQHARLNLASGTYTSAISASTYDAPLTTSRNRSRSRNDSVYFNGSGNSGSAAPTNLATSTSTLRYSTLANHYYKNLTFYYDSGTTYFLRPGITLGRNGIYDAVNTQYFYAQNTGNIYFVGPVTIDGNTVNVNQTIINEGGRFYSNATMTGPLAANQASGPQFNIFGGQMVFGAQSNVNFRGSNPSTAVMFYVRYTVGNALTMLGKMTNSVGTYASTFISNFFGSNVTMSGATLSGLSLLNASQFAVGVGGSLIMDRGAEISFSSGSVALNNSVGGTLFITNSSIGSVSDATKRVSTIGMQTNSGSAGAYIYGGGTTGGWPAGAIRMKTTGSPKCWYGNNTTTDYHLHSDSFDTNGVSVLPKGTSTYEPLIIANRASWLCVK